MKLGPFCPTPAHTAGVLLHVRINGGRPLRLLLDSGAEFIVIGGKAGRSLGLTDGPEIDLVGLGSRTARVGRAETVEIGPLRLCDRRVAVVEGNVVEGADGVIPLSLFSDFILRLDLPHKTLGLTPYAPQGDAVMPATRGETKHPLLLVAGVINGTQSGYMVLDTGAYCSAVSREIARTLRGGRVVEDVQLGAGTGPASGERLSSAVRFGIADQELVADEVVALDLSNLSRHYGANIAGVLGFPALSKYVLTVDYRNGRVHIALPRRLAVQSGAARVDTQSHAPAAFR